MKRPMINLLTDLAAAVLFLGMMATGYIIRFPLEPGTNKLYTLWGLTRHQWGIIHTWISIALLGTLFFHIVLHWQWIACMVGRNLLGMDKNPRHILRTGLLVLGVFVASFSLFAWTAHINVREIKEPRADVCPPAIMESSHALDTPNGNEPKVNFWKDVYPIFEKHCLSCHGPKKQKGGFRVDSKPDFFATKERNPLVVPGQSSKSPLVAIISGQNKEIALPERHHLSEQNVNLIKAWIDTGAEWPVVPSSP